jgi:hypothetical protein
MAGISPSGTHAAPLPPPPEPPAAESNGGGAAADDDFNTSPVLDLLPMGVCSDRVVLSAERNNLIDAADVVAATASRLTGNDLFREQKYPEVRAGAKHLSRW